MLLSAVFLIAVLTESSKSESLFKAVAISPKLFKVSGRPAQHLTFRERQRITFHERKAVRYNIFAVVQTRRHLLNTSKLKRTTIEDLASAIPYLQHVVGVSGDVDAMRQTDVVSAF